MSRKTLLTAIVAVAIVVPLAAQNVKVLKAPKPSAPVECTMEGEIQTDPEGTVWVGRDVATYGPIDQALYIHKSLLPPEEDGAVGYLKAAGYADGYYGPYFGQIRVLDNRIDYLFDRVEGCVQDNASPDMCPFWVIVADGVPVYEKIGKTRVLTRIAFDEGRYLLYQKTCNPAEDPSCLVKLYGCYDERDCPGVPPGGEGYVYATVNVLFQ